MGKNHIRLFSTIAACLSAASTGRAEINLELRPVQAHVRAEAIFDIGLYAVSDSESNQAISAMDVILEWDPAVLQFNGVVNNGPYNWFMSGMFNDSGADGLNNTFDDGDAYYTALAQFANPAQATPGGLLVTTLRFTALAPSSESSLVMPHSKGDYSHTIVYGHPDVAVDVTGDRVPATFLVCIPAADGDLNQDGYVNGLDVQGFLTAVLSEQHQTTDICHGDFNDDSIVDQNDIAYFVDTLLGG